MKNPFLKINRIEFLVTLVCSGKCRHCSVGPRLCEKGKRAVDPTAASAAIEVMTELFDIRSVMTFGGEPLLFADATCQIHKAAARGGIPKRQLITNGYFSRQAEVIRDVAANLRSCGVNDVLISVDAFHQETIPLEPVRAFAEALIQQGVEGVRFHPSWVVDQAHTNRYNDLTRGILERLSDLDVVVSGGNNIWPEGNAALYLGEFYPKPDHLDQSFRCGDAPYTSRLDEISSLSIEPDGSVKACEFTIGNIHRESIRTIVERYDPYRHEAMRALIEGGVEGLTRVAGDHGISVDTSDCHSACAVCRKTVAALEGADC